VAAVFGWKGTVGEFLAAAPSVPHRLGEAHTEYYAQNPGRSQRTAWTHEIDFLADALRAVPQARDWGLVMEYELPFEGGRRVDKIALAADSVIAIEFKDTAMVQRADLDQVRAYARDLTEYHSSCRDKRVDPVLVVTGTSGLRRDYDGTTAVSPDDLPFVLGDLGTRPGSRIDVDEWLRGSYAPLPTLVDAARRVFRDEPLPAIRRADNAGIPKLIAWLKQLVAQAQRSSERHLVLLTGIPGSGKTLVGLQFVHEFGEPGVAPAVFLSGNGPLVELLQYVLKSKVFVRPMRNFILEYGVRQGRVPTQHVLVFDEAQRAWDQQYVNEKHNVDKSEPDMLIEIACRLPEWSVVIGLVGEGQEIHLGEESGLRQWADAIARAPTPVTVHLPPHVATVFPRITPDIQSSLNLTTSMRTHRARLVQEWVDAVIGSDLNRAAQIGPQLKGEDYDLYVTSDLNDAKAYAHARYVDDPEKRYGLLASAKGRNLPFVGVNNNFAALRWFHVGPWYSAPRTDPESCCQLQMPATEFQCQGLELDLPIVCWGDDLRWIGGRWSAFRSTRKARFSDKLRLNSYRVLLTRGRDGTVIYVPHNLPDGQAAVVLGVFKHAGARDLAL